MIQQPSFSPLLLVLLLAFSVPLVLQRFKRLRLPIVVGEILAGILIGRSGLQLVTDQDATLNLLAELGFVFLMFLSGMEVDFSALGITPSNNRARPPTTGQAWSPIKIAATSFMLTLGLSVLIGLGLATAGLVRNAWMMALILSTTSLGVVMPVLKEAGLSGGRFGQTILVAALIADFATMLLITILVAVLSHGLTFEILLVGLLFVAFFLMYRFGMLFFNRIGAVRRTLEELSQTTARIKVRAAFTMMLIFVVLSEKLGTEIILGAFLAGAIVSLLRTPDDVEVGHQLEAFGFGFFIPIFFIMVGANFNLAALTGSAQALLLVPLLLLAAIVVKFIPTAIFRINYSWRETIAAGSLLSSRLSLIIAAAAIGVKLGVIGESVNAAIILVAIITVTFAPLLFTRLMPDRSAAAQQFMVVVGAGQLGLQVARQLSSHGENVVVIDSEAPRVERAQQMKLAALTAAIDQPDSQATPFLDKAKALVCTYSDAETSYRVCHLARTTFGIEHVVAQVSETSDLARFEQLGVSTMNAALDRASLLVLLARNPAVYDLLTRTDDDKEVCEVSVDPGTHAGKTLRQLALPGDVLILALRRDGELLVPHGNTRLSEADHLTLVGSLEHIEAARRMFAGAQG